MNKKLDVTIETLFKYNPAAERMPAPTPGFHTLHMTRFYTDDDYVVTWAWAASGEDGCYHYTIAAAYKKGEKTRYGLTWAYTDYVFEIPIPEKMLDELRPLTPNPLLLSNEIAGFLGEGLFVAEAPLAPCLKGSAKVWYSKYGVYIPLTDLTYHLIPSCEYEIVKGWDMPTYRQGSLLIYKTDIQIDFEEGSFIPITPSGYMCISQPPYRPYFIDCHHFILGYVYKCIQYPNDQDSVGDDRILFAGPAKVECPGYETLEIPKSDYLYEARLLPGQFVNLM